MIAGRQPSQNDTTLKIGKKLALAILKKKEKEKKEKEKEKKKEKKEAPRRCEGPAAQKASAHVVHASGAVSSFVHSAQ